MSAFVRTGLIIVALVGAGCGECGRRLFFFTNVTDSAQAPVAGATVTVDCTDASDGVRLSAQGSTDATGAAAPGVHAQNRDCPSNRDAHSAYFQRCSITVRAAGFRVDTRTLLGADLDALPEESAGQAGHGVRLAFTLARQ